MNTDDLEIESMQTIAKALKKFDDADQDTVDRVLRWANDRFGSEELLSTTRASAKISEQEASDSQNKSRFDDIASLIHVLSPKTDAERALATAYWCHSNEDLKEFTGQEINNRLKDLGYGITNITDAMTSLMRRKPSLIMQTAKRGNSKQARKRYRLTIEGIRECESRIPQQS